MINTNSLFEIEQAFHSHLLSLDHPLTKKMQFDTGKFVRYPCSNTHKRNIDAGYIAYSNGRPTLIVVCNRCFPTSVKFSFQSNNNSYSPNDAYQIHQNIQKRKEEQAINYSASLMAMRLQLKNATPCASHTYFDQKGLTGSINESDGFKVSNDGQLLCPLRLIGGDVITTQSITSNGRKRFYSGLTVKDGFHILLPHCSAIEEYNEIFFGEGVATCLTIRNAVQRPVIVCYGKRFFDIAPIIAKQYPNKQFIYCSDLPSTGEKITSEDNAKKAIALVGGLYMLPNFSMISEGVEPQISRSDFNDLFFLLVKTGVTQDNALLEIKRQLKSTFNSRKV